jgi:malonate-semialdehyde dehydrogenase (acetylating)/methylmalonate-semialdehyde dehydrogenase
MRTVPHFVRGEHRLEDREGAPIFNPATGEQIAEVTFASPELLDEAIRSAREAAASWSESSLSKRTQVLFAFREALVRRSDDLARLITLEHGKTIPDALGEIARGIENVEYACGLSEHLKGEFSSQVADGVDVHSVREPVGVIAAITPFNFPAMVPLWMVANALAAGNAVVLKPSERDPSASVLIAEMLIEAGLPAGVMNVVQGDRTTVDRLLDDPGVDAISFVGSTPVARHVHLTGTAKGKRVQALGGAKNHMVVLADADLDVAADAVVSAAFGSAGERCMAISVVVAVDAIADALIERIATRVDLLTVGAGDDPASDFGPLITREHRDRVAGFVDGAERAGATIVRDGRELTGQPGFFLGATVVDGVRPGMACYDEEIFGPVLSVVRVADFDEALGVVNANEYGNGVAIFTRDGNSARLFSRRVSVGMVGVNVAIPVPVASYSFGGWKNSLFGHSHIYGPEGFAFYTRGKVVTTRWPQPTSSQLDLGFPRSR